MAKFSTLQDVRGVRPGKPAFNLQRPTVFKPQHWWFHHEGGRSEAQWNVGMYTSHLRFGIGFNVSGGGFLKREPFQQAFDRFTRVLRDHEAAYPGDLQSRGIRLEIHDSRGLQFLPVSQWPNQIEHWILIGRLLNSDYQPSTSPKDARVLATPQMLFDELERVANLLWPLWLASQV